MKNKKIIKSQIVSITMWILMFWGIVYWLTVTQNIDNAVAYIKKMIFTTDGTENGEKKVVIDWENWKITVTGDIEVTNKITTKNLNVSNNANVTKDLTVNGNLNIGEWKLKDNTIVSADIKDGEVTSSDIKDGTIVNADISNNAITSSKIKDGEVKNQDIANGAVNSAKVADNSLTKSDIGSNAVWNDELKNDESFTMKWLTVNWWAKIKFWWSQQVRFENSNELNMYVNDTSNTPATLYINYRGWATNIGKSALYVGWNNWKVWIWTTSPWEKLEVAGNVKASKLIDRDNTSFYIDPAFTSKLNTLYAKKICDLNWHNCILNNGETSSSWLANTCNTANRWKVNKYDKNKFCMAYFVTNDSHCINAHRDGVEYHAWKPSRGKCEDGYLRSRHREDYGYYEGGRFEKVKYVWFVFSDYRWKNR